MVSRLVGPDPNKDGGGGRRRDLLLRTLLVFVEKLDVGDE